MAIGRTYRFERIAGHLWKQFAADVKIHQKNLVSMMRSVYSDIAENYEGLLSSQADIHGSMPLYERLFCVIREGLENISRAADSME